MNKITLSIVSLLVLSSAFGVYFYTNNKKEMIVESEKMISEENMIVEEVMNSEEKMNSKDSMDIEESKDTMNTGESTMKKGVYEIYSSEKVALAETGDVVLFFHASWCPSCRSLNSDIENNKSLIPEGVSILKVDYDKEIDMKKKYGVTYQHTLVQIDKDGNLIKKWSGSPSLSSLLSQIQ